jgi:muconolactone delta-isomerase
MEGNMRFLVTTKVKFQMPPEVAPQLMTALSAWAKKYADNGKMEAVWANAGSAGGGGILSVSSLGELDAIMAEFPIGPFSEVEVVPITDLQPSLERTQQMFEAMVGG